MPLKQQPVWLLSLAGFVQYISLTHGKPAGVQTLFLVHHFLHRKERISSLVKRTQNSGAGFIALPWGKSLARQERGLMTSAYAISSALDIALFSLLSSTAGLQGLESYFCPHLLLFPVAHKWSPRAQRSLRQDACPWGTSEHLQSTRSMFDRSSLIC